MKVNHSFDSWCELLTQFGVFRMYDSGLVGVRIVTYGDIKSLQEPTLLRVHSSCTASELFQSLDCDCADQLHQSMQYIAEAGEGIIIHLRQEGRGHGISKKIQAVRLMQTRDLDTVEAFDILGLEHDPREYSQVVDILESLNITKIRLITNNPNKLQFLANAGITITDEICLPPRVREENRDYLLSKKKRLGHDIDLPK